MTIIVAMIDETGATIGTDSLYTWEEGFAKSQGHKFIQLPSECEGRVIVASAGQEKFSQIFERMARDAPKLLEFSDRYGLMKLAGKLFAEVGKLGVGDAEDNNLPDHDLGFVIATATSKKIWTIDADYSVGEHDQYLCIGSGYILAESAMKTLTCPDLNIHWGDKPNTARMVRLVVDITSSLHPYCGGGTHIRQIKYV